MRCKACNRRLTGISWNEKLGKWTEYCLVCIGESREQVSYSSRNWNDPSSDAEVFPPWDPERGPRPACLDWSDEEILAYLYKAFGLEEDYETLKQLQVMENHIYDELAELDSSSSY